MIRNIINKIKITNKNYTRKAFLTTNIDELLKLRSKDEIIKELLRIQQLLGNYIANSKYNDALDLANDLSDKIKHAIGSNNFPYASSVSNVALMNRYLGNYEKSIELYTKSLSLYRDLLDIKTINNKSNRFVNISPQHSSYAVNLLNLGIVYKLLAEISSGIEKLELIERSIEALNDAKEIQLKIHGAYSKEVMIVGINIASSLRLQGKLNQAEDLFLEYLSIARKTLGTNDLTLALILNNFGLLMKQMNKYSDGLKYYNEALLIRRNILGESHSEVIITMHNIAELHIAQGNENESINIQNKILELMEREGQELSASIDVKDYYYLKHTSNNLDIKINYSRNNKDDK